MTVYRRGKIFYMNFALNGVRVFKSTGMTTKKEAKAVELAERQRLMVQSSSSASAKSAKVPLREAIEQVYEERWQHGKDGFRTYRRACLVAELLGNTQLGEIDEEAIARLTRKLKVVGAQPGTMNRYLAVLKTVLKAKHQRCDFIKLYKERKGRIRVISEVEEREALSLLQGVGNEAGREVADLLVVLLDTGLRLNEALKLSFEDVNFDTNMISVWLNKGDKPRSVPMTKRVRAIMETRFATQVRKPFTLKDHQAEHIWRWLRKQMGLENDAEFVLHAARHSCASRLVNRGVDLYVVKEWLGHSSIQVTERYAHLSPSKLASALEALEP